MKLNAIKKWTERMGSVREPGLPGGPIPFKRRRQKGTILALTAVMITVLLGMLALSIDLGYAFSVRNQLQNGVDAAALAGASALRATIEQDFSMTQQEQLAKGLAVSYAGYNQVRRYADPESGSGATNNNRLVIDPGQVAVDVNHDFPQVKIDTNLSMPLLFAGLFGLTSVTIQAVSKATLLPVDGGTGGIGACWRPILLPDSYFDSGDAVHYPGDPLRGVDSLPNRPGDYYRSRFAAGNRNILPYVDSYLSSGSWVTGLRDTTQQVEVGSKTLMGKYVLFKKEYYRIADFTSLPRVTFSALGTGDIANFGYCGEIRVGDLVTVYPVGDATTYDQVRVGLSSLKYRTNDTIDLNQMLQYRYIKSATYPSPNSHATIIPVLLFDPFELVRNPAATQLRVTNIGLFYLQDVGSDGLLTGFFVREIMSGGTQISEINLEADSQNRFRRNWLPTSAQLMQ